MPTTPADQNGCACRFLPHSARPSPLPSRVGIRIATFEACSGFTRYGPLARSAALRRPLSQGSGPLGYPTRPPASYSINRLTIEMESSSIGNTRPRGALGKIACRDPTACADFAGDFAHAVKPRGHTAWALRPRGGLSAGWSTRAGAMPTLVLADCAYVGSFRKERPTGGGDLRSGGWRVGSSPP